MPAARDAKQWAADGGLQGIGDSLYTPFSGPDGDAIDWEAYRALVRYCVGDLGHAMLWLTSGVGEWWSLTLDERKRLTEEAITTARAIAPDTVIQACTCASSAKDCVELTLHAQQAGADICYIQTPPTEVHGGEGVQRFFQYVAERTDIALGMFNSTSSGCVLTPADVARIYRDIPAVCALKEGTQQRWRSKQAHRLAPGLVIWECDALVYRAGWLQQGIVGPAQLGTTGYLLETPQDRRLTTYWTLVWECRLGEAIDYARETDFDRLLEEVAGWFTRYPGRPDYLTHWGEAFRYAAAVIGLPVGDYPHSRPPQALLPEAGKQAICEAYERVGFARAAG
ncbi:dihydrodipicolinate synthase family protein [Mangrovimicrobium sediminis]|uniref:Dihydrodipicolinate synthase family protein n=1 Tax=Mangrovimicrobium sediminis TaxID=2562682 RepID=A0A4Z0M1R8_9GAMM|nr:dihydrodipicolinate synthase family protein [Haliea sp. SAOS-164]TGD73308.1 dihydrodipicolinate synthase family protein [Haliea sp. SAOS-164]